MKIRMGFVSNSSSSSFIIGYGVIKDREKLLEYLNKNNIQLDYNVSIHDVNKIDNSYYNDKTIVGGNNTEINIPKDIWYTKDLLIVTILNNEGDGEFWNGGEMDYDKARNIEFFNENQQKIINLLDNNDLFENNICLYGAERNG